MSEPHHTQKRPEEFVINKEPWTPPTEADSINLDFSPVAGAG